MISASLAFMVFAQAARAECQCPNEKTPRITANGAGKITVKPDEATITIGVTNEEKTLKRCFERQTADMNRVIEEIKKMGVGQDDIKTLGYRITPKTKDKVVWWGRVKPDSYVVSHTLSIKVRDVSKLGGLIDKVVESGVTNINNLDFGYSKIKEVEMEAKVKAVQNAKAKAEAMAKGAGAKTGKIIEINDTGGPVPVYRGREMRMMAMASDNAQPDIEPGSIEVEAGCNIVIELTQQDGEQQTP